MINFNYSLPRRNRSLLFRLLSILFFTFSIAQFNTVNAQFLGCTNCTANDDHVDSVVLVQLNPAYTPTNGQPQFIDFPSLCSGQSTTTGYLKIAFKQNATTRYGISLAGNILVNGVYSSTFTYCDPAQTSSGSFVKYVSNSPITFTCGTQLSLQNLFIGWGNSAGSNACPVIANNICQPGPHCEQLPLTPGGPPIVIVTPLSANFSYMGSCSAAQTAQSYFFNALDATTGTTGGTPPYTFSWNIVNKATSTHVATLTGSSPSFDFSPYGTGTYTVTLTVTDAASPAVVGSISKDISVISCCAHNANAGMSGTLALCAGTTPTDAQLFAQLTGSPDAGGVWTGPVGGVYTYTVAPIAPCTMSAMSTVTVSTQAAPNAGTNGTLNVCSGTTPTTDQLFAALGGSPDAGGSWSGPVSGVYTYTVAATSPCTGSATATVTVTEQAKPNPGTSGSLVICAGSTVTDTQLYAVIGTHDAGSWSPAFAGAGTYTFTVTATAPCTTDATSTVKVTEQAKPNPGTSGSLVICAGSTVTDTQLYAIIGTHDAGSWSPAFAGAGTYTFTVTATAPCTTDATSTVKVTEQAKPNPGTSGSLVICAGSTVTDTQLYAIIGTHDAGSWSPAFAGAGTYTFTVTATAPCTTDATSTVKVTEQAKPNPGTSGSLVICAGSTVTDTQLYAIIGTHDAGSWSPAFAGAGTYTFTVTATAPCTTDATSTVKVTEQAKPNPGTSGSLVICAGSTVTDTQLYAIIGTHDAGSWSPAFAGAGTYTFTVTATAPCTTDATSTVKVTEQAKPNPGTSGSLVICAGSTVTDTQLYAVIGTHDAGSWSPAFAGAGTYTFTVTATAPCTTDATSTVKVTEQAKPNPGTSGSLVICAGSTVTDTQLYAIIGTHDAGSWSPAFAGAGTYTFTVTATAPCTTDATSTVKVTEQAKPNPGTSGSLVICAGSTVTDTQLYAIIGTHDAGSWSPAFAGAGTYTFTVTATAPCTTDATSTVKVTEQAKPNAGTNGTLTICAGTTPTTDQLYNALGSPKTAGGSWSAPVNGVYTYTVAATSPCTGSATATVTVTTQAKPNAGTNGTLTICAGTTPTTDQLYNALGSPKTAGGSWSGPVSGVYTYTVAATAPCTVAATATVTVTVQAQPNAGTNGTLSTCMGTTITNAMLFSKLGGSPDANGSWSGPDANGVYTYTVKATSPCMVPATSTVTVTLAACGTFYTYTQGYYSGTGVSCTPGGGIKNGSNLIAYAISNMPGQMLYLGSSGHSFTAYASDATKLSAIMPGGGTASSLAKNYNLAASANYPPLKNGKINNILLSQTITLALNINIQGDGLKSFILQTGYLTTQKGYGCPVTMGACSMSSLQITTSTGLISWINTAPVKTVHDLLNLASAALGGASLPKGVSLTDINNAVDVINRSFDGGAFFLGYYNNAHSCSSPLTLSTSAANLEVANVNEVSVTAYPNPFRDQVKFSIASPVSGKASLDLYNVMGQRIARVFEGYLFAGRSQVVEYNTPSVYKSTLIYVLKVGDKQLNGKLIQIK